jgi:hypothetical protein
MGVLALDEDSHCHQEKPLQQGDEPVDIQTRMPQYSPQGAAIKFRMVRHDHLCVWVLPT